MAITPETPSSITAPNTLTDKTTGTVSTPNTLNDKAAGNVSVPNTLTEQTAGTVGAPNSLTGKAVGNVAVPNTVATQSAGSVSVPNTLNEQAVTPVSIPNTITETTASTLPRTLTPLVDLNFSADTFAQSGVSKALSDITTYSRPSSATFINRQLNPQGQWEYFVDTDYVGNVTNLLTYSEQFDNAAWAKTNSGVSPNQVQAPFGSAITADLLYESTAASTTHYVRIDGLSITSGITYTASVYAKKGTRHRIVLANYDGSTTNTSLFDLDLGILVSGTLSKIEAVGDDWYRCSQTFTAQSTITSNFIYQVQLDNGSASSYTGDGSSGVYIFGAQLTASTKDLPYVKTTSASASQTFAESLRIEYDPTTGENLGALIEGSSTNLFLQSESMNTSWSKVATGTTLVPSVTENYALAPDSTTSANRIVFDLNGDVSGGQAIIRQTPTVTQGVDATASFWVKSNTGADQTFKIHINGGGIIDFTATSEWKRVQLTDVNALTSNNSGLATTGGQNQDVTDLLVWGAQFEQLPFASSYIPTTTSAVSRSADNLSLPQASVLTNNQLTVKSVFDSVQSGNNFPMAFKANGLDGTITRHYLSGSTEDIFVQSGDNALNTAFDFNGDVVEVVTSFGGGTLSSYVNGQAGATTPSSNFTIDTSSNLYLGSTTGLSQFIYGHISEFKTYNKALTATEVSLL